VVFCQIPPEDRFVVSDLVPQLLDARQRAPHLIPFPISIGEYIEQNGPPKILISAREQGSPKTKSE
jgi:hypothetical protein